MTCAERQRAFGVVAALIAACVTLALAPSKIGGQQTGGSSPPLIIRSMAGRDLYDFYCAACHGRDGGGRGPAAPALRVAPPDLRTLAARHGGAFPAAAVRRILAGERDIAAHGSREMPIWGQIFDGLDADGRLNRIRIDNIVAYLGSIQTR